MNQSVKLADFMGTSSNRKHFDCLKMFTLAKCKSNKSDLTTEYTEGS